MRFGFAGLFALACVVATAAAATPKPLEPEDEPFVCNKPMGLPAAFACKNPDILAAEGEVSRRFQALRGKFKGHDLRIFEAGQYYWRSNLDHECAPALKSGGYPPDGEIADCLRASIARRGLFLNSLAEDPSRLKGSVADYEFVEIWYLKEFARTFEGRTMTVYGAMKFLACGHPEREPRGHISDNGAAMDIVFTRIDETDMIFLCEKVGAANWTGVLRLDHGKPYLYADNVNGRKLP